MALTLLILGILSWVISLLIENDRITYVLAYIVSPIFYLLMILVLNLSMIFTTLTLLFYLSMITYGFYKLISLSPKKKEIYLNSSMRVTNTPFKSSNSTLNEATFNKFKNKEK